MRTSLNKKKAWIVEEESIRVKRRLPSSFIVGSRRYFCHHSRLSGLVEIKVHLDDTFLKYAAYSDRFTQG